MSRINAMQTLFRLREPFLLVSVFVLLSASIAAAGYCYFLDQERRFHAEVARQVAGVAQFKADYLTNWRQDYLKEAEFLFKNESLQSLARSYCDQPTTMEPERQLRTYLSLYLDRYHFDQARLVDRQGLTRIAIPKDDRGASSEFTRRTAETFLSRRVSLTDFFGWEEGQKSSLAVLIPVLDKDEARPPIAVIALRVDPANFIYTYIRQWPVASHTAENLLVRRDGNEVVILNDRSSESDTAMGSRFSLDRKELPCVQAALGTEGAVEEWTKRGEL